MSKRDQVQISEIQNLKDAHQFASEVILDIEASLSEVIRDLTRLKESLGLAAKQGNQA